MIKENKQLGKNKRVKKETQTNQHTASLCQKAECTGLNRKEQKKMTAQVEAKAEAEAKNTKGTQAQLLSSSHNRRLITDAYFRLGVALRSLYLAKTIEPFLTVLRFWMRFDEVFLAPASTSMAAVLLAVVLLFLSRTVHVVVVATYTLPPSAGRSAWDLSGQHAPLGETPNSEFCTHPPPWHPPS